ncbi:unnamed protein product [Bemisia tabaci]|uniref:RNA helicase n=1 Tax=Bemisia tabaci TaxID=7038 RepID=A0A9P0F086_BEMTA|nr:unnamed protein product [Bemisia tabaci]
MSAKEEKVVGFELDEPASKSSSRAKKKKKSQGFQGMGLSSNVLRGIVKRGYNFPTPIQRQAIPQVLDGKDVVAMARTGSGKTACFLIPMFEKLKLHSANGVRALVLSPTRELAIQTFKFFKDLGRFTDLRAVLILGGDSMDTQFSTIHSSPDCIIATPGRFLHLIVEMNLSLKNVRFVVFDEADRLFEMGFGEQMREILHRLPDIRQTMLFSATLPKVIVHFTRAGLSNPVLIRLDLDNKLPDTLECNFYNCRDEDKLAALICILKKVIKPGSLTVVFVATKHHVEMIHEVLDWSGIKNTFLYSDLHPLARKINAAKFQMGKVDVLVVTDIAARGIDIPLLDSVINYHFPPKPKLFVHRVGRVARAGRQGTAYSLISHEETCYLFDLHLFLGRPLHLASIEKEENPQDFTLGSIPTELLNEEIEELRNAYTNVKLDLEYKLQGCTNAFKQFNKSRPGASKESVRRAKQFKASSLGIHPSFYEVTNTDSDVLSFLNKMKNYKPNRTIFDKVKDFNQTAKDIQFGSWFPAQIAKQKEKKEKADSLRGLHDSNAEDFEKKVINMETFPKRIQMHVDSDYYIRHAPDDEQTEKGLSLDDGRQNIQRAAMDITADDDVSIRKQKTLIKKWDPSSKKYVFKNTDTVKKVKSESGYWIPTSYKSGRYDKWVEKNKIQEESEDSEDETVNPYKKKPTKPSGLVTHVNTHWARHNQKILNKSKPILKSKDSIMKQRNIKEKMKKKNKKKTKK